MPFSTAGGGLLRNRLIDAIPHSSEDMHTPHSFLSDSSLDGATEALKEEEEEEYKEGGVSNGQLEEALGPGEELGGGQARASPSEGNESEHDRNRYDEGHHVDGKKTNFSDGESEAGSGDMDKSKASVDRSDLTRNETYR